MSACAFLTEQASDGVAPALRAVDCLAGETVVWRWTNSSTAAAPGPIIGEVRRHLSHQS